MLVVTRTDGEEVDFVDSRDHALLGRIRVVSVRGKRVRIAFEMPEAVEVVRTELTVRSPALGKRVRLLGESVGKLLARVG